MHNARLWFSRVVTLYALAIFTFLAWLYIVEPLEHIERFGVAVSGSPESINFLRCGPGAMFSAMALAAAYGLSGAQRLAPALRVLVLVNACVVGARLLGIAVDGVTPLQLTELRDEGVSWLAFVAALLAHPGAAAAASAAARPERLAG
jgi:hypothetical protein